MKSATVSCLLVAVPLLGVTSAVAHDDASSRIEVRMETVVNRDGGAIETCEAVLSKSASSSGALVSWSALAEGAARCGAGRYPGVSPAPSFIQEVSVEIGWSAGAGDPGPVGAIQLFLTLESRQQSGHSADGQPLYAVGAKQLRSSRLEPGEEFLVPVPLDPRVGAALGFHDVLLRVRAGWAARDGATDYGTIAVVEAAPGSDVALDGGLAGRTGADGTLLLASVPAGQREIRVRGKSGPIVARMVSVLKGRTLLVSPAATSGSSQVVPNGKNSGGFQEYRRARDGAIMIQVPEGEFLMGNLEVEGAPLPHTVHVSAFLIDKLPVTVALFNRFASATGRPLPPDPYWGVHDDFPVAFVRWDEARAYCEWAGGRLPTEAEREKAARGIDGRMFPWGSDPPSAERAVFGRHWGVEGNDAVGLRPAGASPYGMLDAEGNMWEACEDWWDQDYYNASPAKDPTGPKTGTAHVERGGSWDSRWVTLSASRRNFAFLGYREGDFGFRCASEPPR